jgi:hypothetical protein
MNQSNIIFREMKQNLALLGHLKFDDIEFNGYVKMNVSRLIKDFKIEGWRG